jgi:hypothetical protein
MRSDDAVEAVRQLKAQKGPEIQIYGSSSFLQTLSKRCSRTFPSWRSGF